MAGSLGISVYVLEIKEDNSDQRTHELDIKSVCRERKRLLCSDDVIIAIGIDSPGQQWSHDCDET
jgi:hypothetical protein